MKQNVSYFMFLLLSSLIFFAFSNLQIKKWEVPTKYQKLKNPCSNKKDTKMVGKTLYTIHCTSCHGKKGMGDGKKAARIKTPMPNFSEDAFQKQTDGAIYFKSFVGRNEMPNFERKIRNDEERWLLINYIRKLKE